MERTSYLVISSSILYSKREMHPEEQEELLMIYQTLFGGEKKLCFRPMEDFLSDFRPMEKIPKKYPLRRVFFLKKAMKEQTYWCCK